MGRKKKFDYQATIESNLTGQADGLTLDELLQRSALGVNRSTLFRHLSHLIEQGHVALSGKARASRYRLLGTTKIAATPAAPDTLAGTDQSAPEASLRDLPNAAPSAADGCGHTGAAAESAPVEGHVRPDFIENYRQLSGHSDNSPVEARKYAAEVKRAVRRIVLERRLFSPVNLQIYLSLMVAREDLDEFSAVVRKELAGLNADKLHHFDLTPADIAGFIAPESPDSSEF